MTRAALWSIKGVDFDAREAAKQAAQRQGMSLGDWLNEIIVEKAEELGVEADEVDDLGRLEAITARLSRLSTSPASQSGKMKREGRSHPARRRSSYQAMDYGDEDDDQDLDEDLDEFTIRRRKRQRNNYSAAALRQMNRYPRERSAARRAPDYFDPELLLDEAVNAFEEGVRETQSKTNAALAKVSRRLANIEAAMDGRTGKQPSNEASIARTAIPQGGPAPAADPNGVQDLIARLEARIDHLTRAAKINAPTPAPQFNEPRPEAIPITPLRPVSGAQSPAADFPPHLAHAILEIAERQKTLEETLLQREEAPPSQLDGEIKAELGRLLKRLEDMRQEAKQREDLFRQESTQRDLWLEKETQRLEQTRLAIEKTRAVPEIDHIRKQLTDMSAVIANLAPRDQITSLDTALHDLTRRIEASRSHATKGDSLQSVDHLLTEVRSLLADFAPLSKMDMIQNEISLLTKRLEEFSGAQTEASAIAPMQGQIDDIRQILLKTLEHRLPLETMQTDLSLLTGYLDQFLEEGSGHSKQELTKAVEDIRARLSQSMPSSHLLSLEGRLDTVSAKIDSILNMDSGLQQIDDLSRQISQFQNAIIHRLEQHQAPSAHLSGLEKQIGRLSEKIDQVARPSNLFPTTEPNRDLVKEAAQLAAQHVLQEVQSKSAIGSQAPLAKDLNQLRQQQVTDNQLSHETLSAVHNRIEKVVDRISYLEKELSDSPKAAPQAHSHGGQGSKNTVDQSGRRQTAQSAHAFDELDPLARSVDFGNTPKSKTRAKNSASLTRGLPEIHIEPGSRLNPDYAPQAQMDDADLDSYDQMFAGDPSKPKSSQAHFIHAARRAAQMNAKAARTNEQDNVESGEVLDKAMAAARARARAAAAAVAGEDEYERLNQTKTNVSGLMSNPIMRKSMVGAACALIAFGSLQLFKLVQSSSATGSYYEQPTATATATASPDPISPTSSEATKAKPKQETIGGNTLIFAPDSSKADGQSNKLGRQSSLALPANDRFPVGAINPVASQAPETLSAEDAQKLGQLREAAQRGQADAQYQLADRLNEGRGLPRDLKLAALWYERAAMQDLPLAQYKLGLVYEKGLGVEKDLAKAKNWYAKAAERGNIKAMHNLAVLLADGGDGAPDYASAKKWFQKAAENGVRDSQFNLAVLNARGLGGSMDAQSAYVWFAIVAQQGDSEASKKRDELSARLSADQLKAAQSTIAAFKPRTPIASVNEGEPARAQTQPQAQTQTTKAEMPTDKQTAVQTPAFPQPKITLKAKI